MTGYLSRSHVGGAEDEGISKFFRPFRNVLMRYPLMRLFWRFSARVKYTLSLAFKPHQILGKQRSVRSRPEEYSGFQHSTADRPQSIRWSRAKADHNNVRILHRRIVSHFWCDLVRNDNQEACVSDHWILLHAFPCGVLVCTARTLME